MNKEVIQTSDINIKVGLNEEKMPVRIDWEASDNPAGTQLAKAMLLSFFDDETRDTFKIDLWTTEMQVMEMDRFFFQTLRGLADTYFRATQNNELAADMQRFVDYFGQKTGILPKE
ncbi:MAG: gliding motility protein GldC [Bacteroidota bacterium]